MRPLPVIFMLGLLTLAAPAAAGAWLREPGDSFMSISSTTREQNGMRSSDTGFFFERGVNRHFTFGLDVHQGSAGAGHRLAFVRTQLPWRHPSNRLALEFALGRHTDGNDWYPMQKVTLSYGRPLSTRWGEGWLNMDLARELRRGSSRIDKLDLTIGLSTDRRINPMLQIETARMPGRALSWAVLPGLRVKGRNDTQWVLSPEIRATPDRSLGLKFALWKEF
jgi:hypothetical protein